MRGLFLHPGTCVGWLRGGGRGRVGRPGAACDRRVVTAWRSWACREWKVRMMRLARIAGQRAIAHRVHASWRSGRGRVRSGGAAERPPGGRTGGSARRPGHDAGVIATCDESPSAPVRVLDDPRLQLPRKDERPSAPPGSRNSWPRSQPASSSRVGKPRGGRAAPGRSPGLAAAGAEQRRRTGPERRQLGPAPRRGRAARTASATDAGLAVGEDRDAEAAGRRLHRVEERPDRLDVVADVGDERDVGGRQRPAQPRSTGQRASTRRTFAIPCSRSLLAERGEHPRRRLEGDHLADAQRQRQRVAAGAGPDVEPGLARRGPAGAAGRAPGRRCGAGRRRTAG